MKHRSVNLPWVGGDQVEQRGIRSLVLMRSCLLLSLMVHAVVLSLNFRARSPSRPLQHPIVVQIRQLALEDVSPLDGQPQASRPDPNPTQSLVQRVSAIRPIQSTATPHLIRDSGSLDAAGDDTNLRPTQDELTGGQGDGFPGAKNSSSVMPSSGVGIRGGAGAASVRCIANCSLPYPAELNGAEGNTRVLASVNSSGDVTGVVLDRGSSNPSLSRLAMKAVGRMKFHVPNGLGSVVVPVNIFYTIRGTDFDRDTSVRLKRGSGQKASQDVSSPTPLQSNSSE